MNATIRTASGRTVQLLAPKPEDIVVADIARALSQQCRFLGHLVAFYSVAQHSVLVSRLVPQEDALEGLLHDAQEAYLGDVVSPLKHSAALAGYRALEAVWEATIQTRFGLKPMPESVREADGYLRRLEQQTLQGRFEGDEDLVAHAAIKVTPWKAEAAEREFVRRFHELTAGR